MKVLTNRNRGVAKGNTTSTTDVPCVTSQRPGVLCLAVCCTKGRACTGKTTLDHSDRLATVKRYRARWATNHRHPSRTHPNPITDPKEFGCSICRLMRCAYHIHNKLFFGSGPARERLYPTISTSCGADLSAQVSVNKYRLHQSRRLPLWWRYLFSVLHDTAPDPGLVFKDGGFFCSSICLSHPLRCPWRTLPLQRAVRHAGCRPKLQQTPHSQPQPNS